MSEDTETEIFGGKENCYKYTARVQMANKDTRKIGDGFNSTEPTLSFTVKTDDLTEFDNLAEKYNKIREQLIATGGAMEEDIASFIQAHFAVGPDGERSIEDREFSYVPRPEGSDLVYKCSKSDCGTEFSNRDGKCPACGSLGHKMVPRQSVLSGGKEKLPGPPEGSHPCEICGAPIKKGNYKYCYPCNQDINALKASGKTFTEAVELVRAAKVGQ